MRVAGEGRSTRSVSSVAIDDDTVILTLASLVTGSDTVEVRYTKPTTGDTLKDATDNEVATFANKTVTNATAAPTVQSASVNGKTLSVTFSEPLADVGSSTVRAFTVSSGGNQYLGKTLLSTGSSGTLDIALDVAVAPGDTVTLSYTKPTSHPVTDLGGNELANFSGQTVTNNTPADAAPVFYRATVDGASLEVKFNASLKTTSTPDASTFTVTVGTTTRNVSSVSISGKTVTLTLASAVLDTDTVKVRYTKPGSGNKLQGTNDAEVATFTDRAVTNDTTDTIAPGFQSASVSGDALEVTFDEALDTGSAPAGSAFTVTAGLDLLVGEMDVAQGHSHIAMAEQPRDDGHRDAVHHGMACKRVAEVVKANVFNPGFTANRIP